MILLLALVFGLATYRLTRLAIKDKIADGLRARVSNLILGGKPRTWRFKLNDMIQCPHCLSGWICLGVTLLPMIWTSVPVPAVTWLAAWAVHEAIWKYAEQPTVLSVPGVVRTRDAKYDTE